MGFWHWQLLELRCLVVGLWHWQLLELRCLVVCLALADLQLCALPCPWVRSSTPRLESLSLLALRMEEVWRQEGQVLGLQLP